MAMPAEQVVALDLMTHFEAFGQEAGTAFFLPFPEAIRELDVVKGRMEAFRQEAGECAALPLMIVSPLVSCRRAQARVERQFALFQVLEALRMHAAQHGRLPQRLSDLDVPVPDDPLTTQPFDYALDGETARLRGPALGGAQGLNDPPLNYEIALGQLPE
jgi:hypothetical protein